MFYKKFIIIICLSDVMINYCMIWGVEEDDDNLVPFL